MSEKQHQIDLRTPETLMLNHDVEKDFMQRPGRSNLQMVLAWGMMCKVSDLAFGEGLPVIAKINNMVFPISRNVLTPPIIRAITSLLNQANIGDDMIYTKIGAGESINTSYQFSIGTKFGEKPVSIRYRINFTKDLSGVSIVMRLNNDTILPLEKIGLNENSKIYQSMLSGLKGLNLVTGAVDSGKTTLQYACLGHFLKYDPRPAFIGTVENPIEGDLKGLAVDLFERKSRGDTLLDNREFYANKFVTQTPVIPGVTSFFKGVEDALRRNTDILMLGEIRTPDEVDAVIAGILQTGKLITGTMHSDTAAMAIDRLVYAMTAHSESERRAKVYDLLSTVNCIVSQKLLTTVDLKRIAVNEVFHVTTELRRELQNTEPEHLTKKVQTIMNDNNATMVHMAEKYKNDGIISPSVFEEFKLGFAR